MSEAKMIADRIYKVEHASIKKKREWYRAGKEKWPVAENIIIKRTSDMYAWIVIKVVGRDLFAKVTPCGRSISKKCLKEVLKAQPWQ